MTEEEKFVIKMLKDSQNTYIENTKVERVALSTDEVKVILNLIDKLEIENSVLKQVRKNLVERIEMKKAERHSLLQRYDKSKEQITSLEKEIDVLANGIRVLGTNSDITTEEIIKEFTEKPITEEYMKEFKSRYISKDEVLKALGYEENGEEYKRIYSKEELILSLIRTINEECDRLEDIEDQKTMLEIHNIENQRDKYWQDKIKDILKKYEKRPLEEGICFYKEIENLLEEQL